MSQISRRNVFLTAGATSLLALGKAAAGQPLVGEYTPDPSPTLQQRAAEFKELQNFQAAMRDSETIKLSVGTVPFSGQLCLTRWATADGDELKKLPEPKIPELLKACVAINGAGTDDGIILSMLQALWFTGVTALPVGEQATLTSQFPAKYVAKGRTSSDLSLSAPKPQITMTRVLADVESWRDARFVAWLLVRTAEAFVAEQADRTASAKKAVLEGPYGFTASQLKHECYQSPLEIWVHRQAWQVEFMCRNKSVGIIYV